MAETRRYTRAGRRTIINGNAVISRDGQYTVLCAPIGALEICRKLVQTRGLWRTSYAMAYGDNEYTLPDDAEWSVISQTVEDFLGLTTNMNCDDLTNSLEDIEAAINGLAGSGGCGCGSGGAGGSSPPLDDTDTGDITGSTGTPPDGYGSWGDYQQAKCDIATWVVDNMIADLQWWQTVSIASLTASALGVGMASVLSGGTILALLVVLVALWGLSTSVISTLEDTFTAGKDDLVCALMAGTDAAGSAENFTNELDDQIEAGVAGSVLQYAAEQVMYQFADTTQINLLYAPLATVENYQIPGSQDCSGCGIECTNIVVDAGVYYGSGYFESQYTSGEHRIQFLVNADDAWPATNWCGGMESVTFVNFNGHTHSGAGNNDFRILEDNNGGVSYIYDSDTPPVGQTMCLRRVALLSGGPFSCQILRNGKCS